MGLFNYIRGVFSPQKQETQHTAWLMDAQPIYTSFGRHVYMSDFVNNAIDRVATEISKIDIRSMTTRGDDVHENNDQITRLFRCKPNEYQTTSDFLSNVEWLRRKTCNAFIYPQLAPVERGDINPDGSARRRYQAFYPLNPQMTYIGRIKNGGLGVRFEFTDGYGVTLPYESIIHLKWRRGTNAFAGGDDAGQTNETALYRTVDALDKTMQGLPKSIEASLQVRGLYRAKTLADSDKLKSVRDDFEEHIHTSKSGIIATDLGGEFTPVNINAPEISPEALTFLKSVIQERYGISAAILSGDYNGTQHSAFYQTALEDFIIQFEQAATACLFTQREVDVGNRVKCYYDKVRYMDAQSKMEMAGLAKDIGNMTLNQINAMFGLPPFPEGNRRLQSLNYVNIEHVDEYQRNNTRPITRGGDND